MTTFTGLHVDPLNITLEQINIEDIAHALALTNRFGGHTPVPINVAQHSVVVSSLCPARQALRGLLHDASEAYLGDIPKPLKCLAPFKQYLEVEEELQTRIYTKYGCAGAPWDKVVKADRLALEVEVAISFPMAVRPIQPSPSAALLAKTYSVWPWKKAERMFLERFHALCTLPIV
ncbi:MAG: hypothetical protein ABFD60_01445 [Bryobacteraceae bacterium]